MRTLKMLTVAIALAGASTLPLTGALAKPADVAAAVANSAARSADNV